MLTSTTKKRLTAGLLATTLAAGVLAGSANADPAQYSAYKGFGSDTTQDVMNAVAGKSNGILYTPIASSAATGRTQVVSFDAVNPSNPADPCVTPGLGAPTIKRPNGSTDGRTALSRAIDGTGYGTAGVCGGVKDVSGLVDFARSSSGPSGSGTALTYIPFGKDAVSFAYYRADGNPVTTLTYAQLNAAFTSTTRITAVNSIGETVTIVPCGIQAGSGTFEFWNTVTYGNKANPQEASATAQCNALIANSLGGRAQENNGPDLKARGDALDGTLNGVQVIIGFSAGAFIAKSNNVASPNPGPGVGIGSISDNGATTPVNLGSPVTGTAPTLAPNATFYADSKFGRSVYNVFDTNIITGAGYDDLKDLFVGSGSKLCQSVATINTFGFLVAPNCGVTTIQGPLL